MARFFLLGAFFAMAVFLSTGISAETYFVERLADRAPAAVEGLGARYLEGLEDALRKA